MVKVFLADDHKLFRESLKKLLEAEQIAEVVAEANDGKELIDLLEIQLPDIVVMDISMPVLDGFEATKKAIEKYPDLKVLMLTSFGDEKLYYKVLEAGAKGIVLKHSGFSELKIAINEIAAGRNWFSNELLQQVIANISNSKSDKLNLTSKEVQVLRFVCDGLTNDQIADKISLSTDTIKWYRKKLLTSSGCRNTAALIIYAIKNEIIKI